MESFESQRDELKGNHYSDLQVDEVKGEAEEQKLELDSALTQSAGSEVESCLASNLSAERGVDSCQVFFDEGVEPDTMQESEFVVSSSGEDPLER